jgi:hypothetical protein
LVPYGEPDEPPGGSGSPLRRLRDQIQAYPPAAGGDPRRRALLYGALGAGALLVGSGVATALPRGSSIRNSGFYLLGKELTAGLVDGLAALAVPLAIIGLLLLLLLLLATLVVYLRKEEGEAVDWLLTAEPLVGLGALGISALGWAALIARSGTASSSRPMPWRWRRLAAPCHPRRRLGRLLRPKPEPRPTACP